MPSADRLEPCLNLVGGTFRQAQSGRALEVRTPYNGRIIGSVGVSDERDVADIVAAAGRAAREWAKTPMKERVRPLERFAALLAKHAEELAETVALESGKTDAEARAGIERGLEVVDFAKSLPNLDQGGALEVSRGVTCEYRREPLGVVAGITPFNFPAMVPMWMFPVGSPGTELEFAL